MGFVTGGTEKVVSLVGVWIRSFVGPEPNSQTTFNLFSSLILIPYQGWCLYFVFTPTDNKLFLNYRIFPTVPEVFIDCLGRFPLVLSRGVLYLVCSQRYRKPLSEDE